MAEFFALIFFALLLQNINCFSVYSKAREIRGEHYRSHLKSNYVNVVCNDRNRICKSNNTNICAVRVVDQTMEYKDFENSCFLFLSNMCDYPGEEYYIVEGGTCELYFKARRHVHRRKEDTRLNATTPQANVTENATSSNASFSTPVPILRGGKAVSPIYDIDTAFDFHICPLRCPDTYNPVCVSANRGAGKYFKIFTFVNHCKGDVYYCQHFDEFAPPPDEEEEKVNSSPLSWSYCAAFRYMQFARFSEVFSSMSHYGWLVGDDRYSRIIPPNERRPGTGK